VNNDLVFAPIRDVYTDLIFSVLLSDGIKCKAIGNMNQGDDWARWANGSGLSSSLILDSLDYTLRADEFSPLTESSLISIKSILTADAYDALSVSLDGISVKSQPDDDESQADEDLPEPEQEPVSAISVIEVGMSLFDAQFKKLAVDYKANYQNTKIDVSSLALSVKATKSVWANKADGVAWKSLVSNSYSDDPGKLIYGKMYGRGLSRRFAMSVKSVSNMDPRTARDADKDRLVLEGIPTVNLGRGVPDPTPFGAARLARRTRKNRDYAVADGGNRKRRMESRFSAQTRTGGLDSTAVGGRNYPKDDESDSGKMTSNRRMNRRTAGSSTSATTRGTSAPFDSGNPAQSATRSTRGRFPKTSRIIQKIRNNPPVRRLSENVFGDRKISGKKPRLDKRTMANRSTGWLNKLSERIASASPPKIDTGSPIRENRRRRSPFAGESDTGRMRRVVYSQTTPMRSLFGLRNSMDDDSANRKNLSEYTPTERALILGEAKKVRSDLLSQWRSRLGLSEDSDVPEDGILTYIQDQEARGKNVYPLQVQAHNLLILDEMLWDAETKPDKNMDNMWWNLKENARARIVSDSGVLVPSAQKQGDNDLSKPPARPVKTPITAPPPKSADEIVKTQVAANDNPWKMDKNTRDQVMSDLGEWLKNSPEFLTFSDRFGENETEWDEFSPSEQSALKREMGYRENELVNTINEIMTPTSANQKDYRINGRITPESLRNMTNDSYVSLNPGGANLYPDIRSLIAIMDLLGAPNWDVKTQKEAWKSIGNRNRNVVSKRADILRRDLRGGGRYGGVVGERTQVTPKSRATETEKPVERPVEPVTTEPTQTQNPSVQATQSRPSMNVSRAVRKGAVKTVTLVDEDGKEIVKEVSAFGDPFQYDHEDQYVDRNGTLYLYERQSKLYRNPVTGEYLENYSDPGMEVDVEIDSELEHPPENKRVQKSAKVGPVVSYPQQNVGGKKAKPKFYSKISNLRLSRDGSRNSDKLTEIQVFAAALGISESELLERLGITAGGGGKVFYLVPGVLEGLSPDTARQAYEIMLMLDNENMTDDMKIEELTTLDVIDASELFADGRRASAAEVYAYYVDPDLLNLGYSADPKIYGLAPGTAKERVLAYYLSGSLSLPNNKEPDYGDQSYTLTRPDGSKLVLGHDVDSRSGVRAIQYPRYLNTDLTSRETLLPFDAFADGELSRRGGYRRVGVPLIPGVPGVGEVKLSVPKLVAVRYHPAGISRQGGGRGSGRDTPMHVLAAKVNAAIMSDTDSDWYEAIKDAVRKYNQASNQMQTALAEWRKLQGGRSRVKGPKRSFIMAQEKLEAIGKIITEILAPNAHKAVNRVRNTKSTTAKTRNQVQRMRFNRSSSTGAKSTPDLEERQLYPTTDEAGNIIVRGSLHLIELSKLNHTEGFLPIIKLDVKPDSDYEISQLTEDQVNDLASIRLAEETLIDPREPEFELLEETKVEDDSRLDIGDSENRARLLARKKMSHKVALDLAGYTYKPVAATQVEFIDLLAEADQFDPTPENKLPTNYPISEDATVLPIVRGINHHINARNIVRQKLFKWFFGGNKHTDESAKELIDGPYFVPAGAGGAVGGEGLNFFHASGGGSAGYTGGKNDKVIMAVMPNARIFHRGLLQYLATQMIALHQMVSLAIYSDSGVERELPIDEDAWNAKNFDFADNPRVYSHFYSPYGGSVQNYLVRYVGDDGILSEYAVIPESVRRSEEELPNRRQVEQEPNPTKPNPEYSRLRSERRYEMFRNMWFGLFGEEPSEKYRGLDSSDAKTMNELLEEITKKLVTVVPAQAQERRKRAEGEARSSRRGGYSEEELDGGHPIDPRYFDIDFLAEASFNADYFLSPEELREYSIAEWAKRTRAQLLSWFIQAEIAKGAEIAKARLAGATPWNEEIRKHVALQEVLLKLDDEVILGTIIGVDGYWSEDTMDQLIKVSQGQKPNEGNSVGRTFIRNNKMLFTPFYLGAVGGQFILLNRTAVVANDRPLYPVQVDELMGSLRSRFSASGRERYAQIGYGSQRQSSLALLSRYWWSRLGLKSPYG